jgi:hypothetical protein
MAGNRPHVATPFLSLIISHEILSNAVQFFGGAGGKPEGGGGILLAGGAIPGSDKRPAMLAGTGTRWPLAYMH